MISEVLLINEQYVRKYTPVNDAVDVNLIRTCTYLAQDKYLTNYLGTDLINRLKTEVEALILNPSYIIPADYLTLLESYVAKALVWWTMVELYPNLAYKHDNGNLVRKVSEDSESVGVGQIGQLTDAARGNAKHYTNELVKYLCNKSSLYPEYTSNVSPDTHPSREVYLTNSLVFSRGNGVNSTKWTIRDLKEPS